MIFDGGEFHNTFMLATLICFFLGEFSHELAESDKNRYPDSFAIFSCSLLCRRFALQFRQERESALCKFVMRFVFLWWNKHVKTRYIAFGYILFHVNLLVSEFHVTRLAGFCTIIHVNMIPFRFKLVMHGRFSTIWPIFVFWSCDLL